MFPGQTQYRLAFEKAFSLLKSSISGETSKTKKRVILFLTDGAPSDPKKELIFQTIRDRNFELNNSVAILTYGFGDADSVILEDIAKQNTQKYEIPANTSVGDITVSSATTILICYFSSGLIVLSYLKKMAYMHLRSIVH